MKMQSKQTKSRAILLSVLVVILCFAVILGATFALFTAKKEYGIGVNTGKIDVEGKLGLTGAWSEGQSGGAVEAGTATENGYQFPQGGEVIVDGAGIQINNMSLGDKAAFNLVVTNKSTVNMKYSVSLTIEEGSDANLLESLKFTVDGEEKLLSGKNSIALLDWTTVSADVQAELPALNFEISLPWSAQDYDLTDNSVSLKVVLEAVQANAYTGNIFAGGQDQETLADAMNAAVNSEDGVVSVGGNLTAEWPTLEQMQQIAETGKPVTIVGAGKSTTTIVATDDEAIYIPANVTVKDVSIEGEVAMDTTASVSDAIINGNVTIAENAAQTISLMSLAALSETEGVVAFDGVTVNGVITAANANLTINKSEINGGISVSGGTLVLTNTVVENENGSALTIAAGTTVTVTDTSLTATGDHTVVNNGTLTIGAGAYVDALTHGKGALVNNKGGVFTLDGGTLTRSLAAGTYEPYGANGNSWYVLSNAGTAVLKDGLVTMNDGFSSLIRNLGPDSQTDAVMSITGGVYRGGINNVKNDEMGILTISGGTFENGAQAAVLNWDNMTISGGTFTASIALLSGFYAENSGDGVNIIEGGTFNGTIEGFIAEVGDYTYAEKATYTITGGNFANAVASAYTLEQMKVFLAAGIEVVLMTDLTFSEDTNFVLVNDFTVNGTVNFTSGTTTVDLNGYTMTINTVNSNAVLGGADVTIKNGDLNIVGAVGSLSSIVVGAASKLTLDNVNYTATGTTIYVQGNGSEDEAQAAQLRLQDSTILTSGVYGIATNASANGEKLLYSNVVIDIINSTIKTELNEETILNDWNYQYDNAPVLINVPGKLNIEGSTLIGQRAGLIVRGGTAVVKNSTIEGTSEWYAASSENRTLNNQYVNGNWGSGTEVPSAPIVVGNRHAMSYQYAANLTLENVEVIKGTVGYSSTTHSVYVYGNASAENGATLNVIYTDAYAGDAANKLTDNMQNKVFVGGGYTSINGGEMSVKSGWVVSDVTGINAAWAFGNKDLILANDILVDQILELSYNVTRVFDLNGKTMTFEGLGEIMLKYGANLTVTGNGTMETIVEDDTTPGSLSGYLFTLSGTSVLTIENGTYICGMTAVQLEGSATANIKGGTFSALQTYSDRYWILNKVDANKDTATFNVTGGTFINFDPSNGGTESPAQNFVSDGYGVVASTDGAETRYTVISVENSDETFVAYNADALRSLLEAGARNIQLGCDVTLDQTVNMKKGASTLDLNGKTVTFDYAGIIDLYDTAQLTVTGNGTMQMLMSTNSDLGFLFRLSGTSVLTIENGTYICGMTAIQLDEYSTANIKGGTFSALELGLYQSHYWILNKMDPAKDTTTFNVTGGMFINFDPSNGETESPAQNFVAAGYTVEESTDGENTIYTVVPVSEEGEAAQA